MDLSFDPLNPKPMTAIKLGVVPRYSMGKEYQNSKLERSYLEKVFYPTPNYSSPSFSKITHFVVLSIWKWITS